MYILFLSASFVSFPPLRRVPSSGGGRQQEESLTVRPSSLRRTPVWDLLVGKNQLNGFPTVSKKDPVGFYLLLLLLFILFIKFLNKGAGSAGGTKVTSLSSFT